MASYREPRGDRRDRDRDREPERRRDTGREPKRRLDLNEYFIDGQGIHREVLQRNICKYLGPDASSRPSEYHGKRGYTITALRPFTTEMMDDLQELSKQYESEVRHNRKRGYEDLPYERSETSRQQEAKLSMDPRVKDPRYVPVTDPGYSSASMRSGDSGYADSGYADSGYTSQGGYPAGSVYSPPQASAYPTRSGYPPGSIYQETSGYGASSGYPSNTNVRGAQPEANYIYERAGDYTSPGYAYPQGAYPAGTQPRDPRVSPQGYPYVTSSQDVPGRRAVVDDRYATGTTYYDPSLQPQPSRGAFVRPGGTPAGGYDPPTIQPQPLDPYGAPNPAPMRDNRRGPRR